MPQPFFKAKVTASIGSKTFESEIQVDTKEDLDLYFQTNPDSPFTMKTPWSHRAGSGKKDALPLKSGDSVQWEIHPSHDRQSNSS